MFSLWDACEQAIGFGMCVHCHGMSSLLSQSWTINIPGGKQVPNFSTELLSVS